MFHSFLASLNKQTRLLKKYVFNYEVRSLVMVYFLDSLNWLIQFLVLVDLHFYILIDKRVEMSHRLLCLLIKIFSNSFICNDFILWDISKYNALCICNICDRSFIFLVLISLVKLWIKNQSSSAWFDKIKRSFLLRIDSIFFVFNFIWESRLKRLG